MIGIIGGTGLYAMRGLGNLSAHEVQTPYGAPSGPLMLGALAGARSRSSHATGRATACSRARSTSVPTSGR